MRIQDIKYFKIPVSKKEDLRKQYRNLSKDYHPDLNPGTDTTKIMQQVNVEYDWLLDNILKVTEFSQEQYDEEIKIDEALRSFIDQVVIIPGITVEIIGSWVWVTGNTYPVREALKEIGMFFSKNKTAWYFHAEPYRKRSKKRFSLDDLRDMFETQKVEGKAGRKLKNPTPSEVSKMWKMAGREPQAPTPSEVSKMWKMAGKEPILNPSGDLEEITKTMNNIEGMISRINQLFSYKIKKAPSPVQKRYYSLLDSWDELKVKRDKLKAQAFKKTITNPKRGTGKAVKSKSGYPKTKRHNPTVNIKNVFEEFNHYEPTGEGKLNIPFEKGLAKIGEVTLLNYLSDKKIFKTDQIRNQKKVREYTHPFDKPANLFVTADGLTLVITMDKRVTSAGIMQ